MWKLASKHTPKPPPPPKFPDLEGCIHTLDLATRALKLKLSSYNFYTIHEHFTLATSPILVYEPSSVLLGLASTPAVVYDTTHKHPTALHAEQVLAAILAGLKKVSREVDELNVLIKNTFRRRFRGNWEVAEEVRMLEEWVQTVQGRVDGMWEMVGTVLAMESEGWEVGVVAGGVGEWEFEMTRGQSSRG